MHSDTGIMKNPDPTVTSYRAAAQQIQDHYRGGLLVGFFPLLFHHPLPLFRHLVDHDDKHEKKWLNTLTFSAPNLFLV